MALERGFRTAPPEGRREFTATTQPHERWSHAMARTVREQQDKRREEKLKQVQEQVDEGSLVIRKMTKKERDQNPPKKHGNIPL